MDIQNNTLGLAESGETQKTRVLVVVMSAKTKKGKPSMITVVRLHLAKTRALRFRRLGQQVDYLVVPAKESSDAVSRMFLQLLLARLDQEGEIILPPMDLKVPTKSQFDYARHISHERCARTVHV